MVELRKPNVADVLRVLYQHAWERSDDPKTKNSACLLTPAGHISLLGVNHLPTGFEATPENLDNKIKDELIIHAEEHVILECAASGISTRERTMVCMWAPCLRCARMIIGAGISRLVVHAEMYERTYGKHKTSIEEAVRRLELGGVEYERWSGKVGGCKGMMNHETWEP